MSIVSDENRLWTAVIKIGDEDFKVQLFDTFDSAITFEEDFMKNLKDLISGHEHYMAGEVLTSIYSPDGEDFSKYAVFLLLIQLGKETVKELGTEHIYLFALRKDGKVQLAGVDLSEAGEEEVLKTINLAFQHPDKLGSLILAYTPE